MHLSTLVCSGQMTRGQALGEVSAPAYPPEWVEPDKTFVAKKLGISREEFDAIMALPKKRYSRLSESAESLGIRPRARSVPLSEA